MSWLTQSIRPLHRILNKCSLSSRTGAAFQRRFIPQLEQLEDRDAPSIATTNVVFEPFGSSGDKAPFSPQEIRSAYGVNQISFTGGIAGNGAGQTIAIVDAFNDPNALSDLQTFDAHFGLNNPPSFSVVNQNGVAGNYPTTDPTGGWELEESLDIEWSHAMAPMANIILVEANSSSTSALFSAVQTAATLPGVSVVSMSWGTQGGFPTETSKDGIFTAPGITFVASTGDSASPGSYPAESPNVVAVGGTTLTMTNGAQYGSETAWKDSGGGQSTYESRPSFQNGVQSIVGAQRGTPDVAFDANPNTGVTVYDTFKAKLNGGAWVQVGGTSVGSPCWAGLIAIADQGRVLAGNGTLSSAQTLNTLYSLLSSDFHDITTGSNGGFKAMPGYDLVTGRGSPVANLLVPGLANSTAGTALAADGSGKAGTNVPNLIMNHLGEIAGVPASAGGLGAGSPGSTAVQVGAGVWVYPTAPTPAAVGNGSTVSTGTPAVNRTDSSTVSVQPAASTAPSSSLAANGDVFE